VHLVHLLKIEKPVSLLKEQNGLTTGKEGVLLKMRSFTDPPPQGSLSKEKILHAGIYKRYLLYP